MPQINPPLPDAGQPRGQEELDVRAALEQIINLINGQLDEQNIATSLAQKLVPVGSVMPFAGATAPTGWLLCDGSAVSRTTYAQLFQVIGTTYGAGDGATTFNLPDMRGRVPVARGTNSAINALGKNDGIPADGVAFRHVHHSHGVPSHSHAIPSHNHTVPNHVHSMEYPFAPYTSSANRYYGIRAPQGLPNGRINNTGSYRVFLGQNFVNPAWGPGIEVDRTVENWYWDTLSSGATTTGSVSLTTSTGGGGATDISGPAFLVLNFIIKA